jgi:hypothetical protein
MILYEFLKGPAGLAPGGIDYLKRRQRENPEIDLSELTSQLEVIASDTRKLIPLNNGLYGLCVGALKSNAGCSEHVLTVLHTSRTARFVVFVAVMSASAEEIHAMCGDRALMWQIYCAVGRTIAMSRLLKS